MSRRSRSKSRSLRKFKEENPTVPVWIPHWWCMLMATVAILNIVPDLPSAILCALLVYIFGLLRLHQVTGNIPTIVFISDPEGKPHGFEHLKQKSILIDEKWYASYGTFEYKLNKRITLSSNQYLIVSGDIIDKGEHGLEWLCLLLDAKDRYGDCVRLNLGNRDLNKGRWLQDLFKDRSWIGKSETWWMEQQQKLGYPLVSQSNIEKQKEMIDDENDILGCARWLEKYTFGAQHFIDKIWHEHNRLQGSSDCKLDSSKIQLFQEMLKVHSCKDGLFFEYAREAKILDVLRLNEVTYILSHSPATQEALAFWRTKCSRPISENGTFDLEQLADEINEHKNIALNESLLNLLLYQDRYQESGILVVGKQIQNNLIKRSEMVFEHYPSHLKCVFVFGHAPTKQVYSRVQGYVLLSIDDSLATADNTFHVYVENNVLHWKMSFDGKSFPQSVSFANSNQNLIGTQVKYNGVFYEVLGVHERGYLLGIPIPNHTYDCKIIHASLLDDE